MATWPSGLRRWFFCWFLKTTNYRHQSSGVGSNPTVVNFNRNPGVSLPGVNLFEKKKIPKKKLVQKLSNTVFKSSRSFIYPTLFE